MSSLNQLKTMDNPEIKRWLKKAEKVGHGVLVMALLGADQAVLEAVLRNEPKRDRGRLKEIIDKFRGISGLSKEIERDMGKLESLF